MMKNIFLKLIMISAILPLSGIAFAEDFSQKSNDEFFRMKQQVRTMDDSTKDAYRIERQNRMQNMNQSERESLFNEMGASGKRNMDGMGQNNRSRKQNNPGGGAQRGNGYGYGKQSQNRNRYRYGQSNDNASGSGQNRYGNSGGNRYGNSGGNRYGNSGGNRYGSGKGYGGRR